MCTYKIQLHDKITKNFLKHLLKSVFLSFWKISYEIKTGFDTNLVNEPSVFESLKFNVIVNLELANH